LFEFSCVCGAFEELITAIMFCFEVLGRAFVDVCCEKAVGNGLKGKLWLGRRGGRIKGRKSKVNGKLETFKTPWNFSSFFIEFPSNFPSTANPFKSSLFVDSEKGSAPVARQLSPPGFIQDYSPTNKHSF
jgi:hypothetical protein